MVDGKELALLEVGRAVFEEERARYGRYSCIRVTAILVELLHLLGYRRAYALTVNVQILNPHLTLRVGTDRRGGPSASRLERLCKEQGSFMVGIGSGTPGPDDWAGGHLVAVLPEGEGEGGMLFDLSIMQADQPLHGIVLRPVFLHVKPEYVRGEQPFGLVVNGCRVTYKAFPEDHSFEQCTNWHQSEEYGVIVARAFQRITDSRV